MTVTTKFRTKAFSTLAVALSLLATECSPSGGGQNSTAVNDGAAPAATVTGSTSGVSSADKRSTKTREQLIAERTLEIRSGPYDGEPGEGHEAGWDWAKENDIFDPSNCEDHGDSFEEGCKAYAEAEIRAAAEIDAARASR